MRVAEMVSSGICRLYREGKEAIMMSTTLQNVELEVLLSVWQDYSDLSKCTGRTSIGMEEGL